ncbi:MAG TPA: hypothetical protein GXX51_04185 [Firmicutes bacterium]|nr:hypothetical protein [Bacillota bacterium]
MVLAKARPVEDKRIITRDANIHRSRAKPGALRSGCPSMLQLGVTAILSVALLLSYLSLHTQTVKLGYELTKANRQLDMLKSEHERLSLAAAQLRSLARIEEDARTRLGMMEPGDVHMVVVDIGPAQGGKYSQPGDEKHEKPAAPGDGTQPGYRGVLATARCIGERISGSMMGLASQFVAKWFFDLPSSQLSASGARG